MSDKWLAAAFYVPESDDRRPRDELLRLAGGTLRGAGGQQATGEWAGLPARFAVERLPYHSVVEAFVRQSSFLDLVEVEPDRHPVVDAMCRGGAALGADMAFVATHLDLAAPERLLAPEWMVLARDSNSLAGERFGLLYLAPELAADLTVPLTDRDSLRCRGGGLLLFSAAGDRRWY